MNNEEEKEEDGKKGSIVDSNVFRHMSTNRSSVQQLFGCEKEKKKENYMRGRIISCDHDERETNVKRNKRH